MAGKKTNSTSQKKTQIYYINIGGGIADVGSFKYAWRSSKDSYKGIADSLGVKEAKDTEQGLIFGANNPRPAEIRISYTHSSGETRTVTRFCEPDKLSSVTTGGTINGKKITVSGVQYEINNATIKTN